MINEKIKVILNTLKTQTCFLRKMAFSMKVISRIPAAQDERNDTYTITPTLVRNGIIHIGLPDADNKLKANVRIFDTNGALKHQTYITGSADVTCELPPGNYFVSLQTNDFHKVEKIMVQH